MTLVSGLSLLNHAHKHQYAIGAFSVDHIDSIDAVIRTAEELDSPVIIQTGQATLKHTPMNVLAAAAIEKATHAKIPVILHLDHGNGFSQAIQAIRYGYTSLMFDGSQLPIEDNIYITKQIKEAANAIGIPLEAELGRVGTRGKDEIRQLTDPDEAVQFVRETSVDSLAIALGNIHAAYGESVPIDLGHLKKVHDLVGVPIVLHGGTGIPANDVKTAISYGVSKVNIATEWRRATIDYLRENLSNADNNDFFALIEGVRQTISDIVREKIQLLGSAGRAWEGNENDRVYVL
ncbi:class II fructose-bisphosphate aldolase [Bacillus sp. FJAT-50079]|uniref:class II fructose-bisphosphate aldolase n=1 Tax=Bacillus sp. FJAT-50079 TaxID=2833577 RepID=UPI001BC9FB9B|nr:class II fructose-bisphosphate aldolase [Bacillus sp. FJAT-50079]MBS4206596.1 class II fructose-bisphosphate aldolase [Bacillus sp. FJAT-50079]